MARLVATKFKIHNAEQFIESLGETSATNLYLFIGKVQEWEDENLPPAPNEAVANTLYSYWDQIIAAKKVTPADVKHVITRVNWESNTAYTAYTHGRHNDILWVEIETNNKLLRTKHGIDKIAKDMAKVFKKTPLTYYK